MPQSITPEAVMHISSIPYASAQEDPQAFPFLRLPGELRHEIYSYLGYPVGAHVWTDYQRTFPNREVRVRILGLSLTTFKRGDQYRPPNGIFLSLDGYSWNVRHRLDTALLSVSKFMRDELLTLLFEKCNVRFLSSSLNAPSLFLPSTLGYMTSITLAGSRCSQLTWDARSVRHIAAHCPSLVHMTYTSLGPYTLDLTKSLVQDLEGAFSDLVRLCGAIRSLRICFKRQRRHVDREVSSLCPHDSLHALEVEDLATPSYLDLGTIGKLALFPDEVDETLDLTTIAPSGRAVAVAVVDWSRSVLNG